MLKLSLILFKQKDVMMECQNNQFIYQKGNNSITNAIFLIGFIDAGAGLICFWNSQTVEINEMIIFLQEKTCIVNRFENSYSLNHFDLKFIFKSKSKLFFHVSFSYLLLKEWF